MNARQEYKLSMYVTVESLLQTNQKIWQALPAFGTAFTKLKNGIQRIKGAQSVAAGIHKAREAVVVSAWKVATGLGGYASANNNPELMAKVDCPLVSMLSVRDTEAATMCQGIHDAANAIVADLAGWRINAATLIMLQANIHLYNAALDKAGPVPGSRPAARELLETKFEAVDKVLAEQVDGLMEKFGASQPLFYAAFQGARLIVDDASSRNDGVSIHRLQPHLQLQAA